MRHDLSFISGTNLSWLSDSTIFVSIYGSHAYGTNIKTSDVDYRGICIPPKEYYTSFYKHFEQADKFRLNDNKVDCTIFDLRKFFALAGANNPNAIEIIFTEPEDHLYVHPIMEKLFQNRNNFLSKKARWAYEGYAYAQMKRLNGHHRWITHPLDHKPTRQEFELPEKSTVPKEQMEAVNAIIKKKLDSWNFDLSMFDATTRIEIEENISDILTEICGASIFVNKEVLWKEAALSAGISSNFIWSIQKEKEYQAKLADWSHYLKWLEERNEIRAELEKKYGYDTKNASHLVRLTRQCIELLTTGTLKVKRPDAEELKDIRDGAWTYQQLVDWFEAQHPIVSKLYKECTILPHHVNEEKLDSLCMEMIEEFLSA